jgi:hypothetical protein
MAIFIYVHYAALLNTGTAGIGGLAASQKLNRHAAIEQLYSENGTTVPNAIPNGLIALIW